MEPIVHAIIPLLFLIALFPNLEKKYLLLLPIVWIIDLDSYFGYHRFYLHNIFFILTIAIILYFIWNMRASLVAFFFGISHLILDSAFPGVAIFYPLLKNTFYIIAGINLFPFDFDFHLGSISLEEYISFSSSFDHSQYFGESSLIFLFLAIILLIYKYRQKIISYISSTNP